MMIEIENNGPDILSSNFWDSEVAQGGFLFVSVNAGAFRLLVPDSWLPEIPDMRKGAKFHVISILPEGRANENGYVLEWLIEDGSDEPYALHFGMTSLDRLPLPDDVGREWSGSVWGRRRGRPHKFFERPAYAQVVPELPWLKRID